MCAKFWILFLLVALFLCEVNGLNVRRYRRSSPSTTPTTTEDDDDDDDWDDEDDESTEIDDDGKIYKNPRNSPSTLCPRDEEQATLLGQKCLRKCSSDEDCKSKKKKCLCDGACGMSCIKPDRECPELDQIPYGGVTTTGNLFGSKATYSCQHGFHVVGLQSRTCQADGQWAGTAPSCKQNIYCLVPPTIEHSRHNALPEQVTFDLDSQVQYYCHNGYVTNGFPRAKCLAIDGHASWYGPDITCEPRSCGTPPDIPNGWHAGECYTYGCKINYHCSENYELVGKIERFCQADGTWIPKELPTCVLVSAVTCTPPENPRHGKAIYTSCSYNSVVSYECKYGYYLSGETTRRCGADKKWTGSQPQCKEINCGHPGRLWNGWLENIEGGTGLGASIIFRCHEGMRLVGNSSTVCQIEGKWRYPLPRCLAPCVVPQVSQGRVILDSHNDTAHQATVVQHGESLSVECESQFEFFGSYSPVTCNNGTWTQIPKCQPARCKHLPKLPKNGMVIAPKMEHGMKARFKCKDGFELKGNEFIDCSFGNWTGELPICQEVYCPFPGFVDHGKILLVGNMGLYDYRPYVRKVINNKQIMYDCDKGYILNEGPPGATCIGGNWQPRQLPRCVMGQHPRLRWSRRRRSIIAEKYKRAFMRHHKVLRSDNYTPPSYIDELFSLSEEDVKYLKERDAALKRLKRALKSTSSSRTVGLSRKGAGSSLSLRRGHKKQEWEDDGFDDIKKQANMQKKGMPCDPLSTEPYINIEIVKHGKDPNVSFSSGTVVKMACGKGYGLNIPENKTAKCTRGKWKPEKPECTILPCHIPEIENAIFKMSKGELIMGVTPSVIPSDEPLNETAEIANGDVIEVNCDRGYKIQGSSNLRCWHGEWTATQLPECNAAPCQLPEIRNGHYLSGYRAGLTIANGSSVTFQCDEEYRKSTTQPIECILGDLYPRKPACRANSSFPSPDSPHYMGGSDIIKGGDLTELEFGSAKSCGPPAKVQGSLIYRNGEPLVDDERNFPHNTEVTFNCIESNIGEKHTWRIICEGGSWIGRSLNCENEKRSKPQGPNNSSCQFRNQEPNVISFYNDQQIREDIVDFPAGAILVSRCIDIGKYSMIGPNKRRCMGGEWDGAKPSCFGLNQENDYSMEKPPTILFRHQLGPIAQSNDGKLIVYPGTILHMECLWIRRFGTPKWTVSHDYRKYPEGWPEDPERDPQLEYRLSIFHASKDDSGTFTCVTPARHTHSVEIVVKAVHCPAVPQRRGLSVNTQSTKLNTKLKFSCVNGNSLIGPQELTCLPSGNWSAPFPVCESIECGDVGGGNLPAHLKVSVVSRGVGGRASFSCAPGYKLQGSHETICKPNGEWALPHPSCIEVQCDKPGSPKNGYMQGSEPFKAGDVVQFNCSSDFMMEGQPIIACQDNGRWSGPVPKCVQACSYPGTTISGRMSSVKFYYRIGENITFTCDEGYTLKGVAMLKCLRTGKWSNTIPTCASDHGTR